MLVLPDTAHMTSDHVFVGLGSNLGDRAGNLLLAVRGMMDAGLRVVRLSSIYETEPVGLREQPTFLNMVAEIERGELFSPEQTLARLLRIEYALGRRRDAQRGPRINRPDFSYGDERARPRFSHLPTHACPAPFRARPARGACARHPASDASQDFQPTAR